MLECLAHFVNGVVTCAVRFVLRAHNLCTIAPSYSLVSSPMNHPNTTSDSTIQCDICNKTYRTRGFGNHRRACEAKRIEEIQLQDRADKAKAKRSKSLSNGLLNTDLWSLASAPCHRLVASRQSRSSSHRTVVKPWETAGQLGKSHFYWTSCFLLTE